MIFLDSNIPMYLVGAPHPLKAESQILLERIIAAGERIVTSVEVIQEILHRYVALQRRDAVAPAVQLVLELCDEVFPVERQDVLRAAEIIQHPAQLSARDALHVAIMERHGVRSILTFDSDFDRWPGLTQSAQSLRQALPPKVATVAKVRTTVAKVSDHSEPDLADGFSNPSSSSQTGRTAP